MQETWITIRETKVKAWEHEGKHYLSLRTIAELNKREARGPIDRRSILALVDKGLFPDAIQATEQNTFPVLNDAWMVPVEDYLAIEWPMEVEGEVRGIPASIVRAYGKEYLSLSEAARLNTLLGKRPNVPSKVRQALCKLKLYPNATQFSMDSMRAAWYIPVEDFLAAPEPERLFGHPSAVTDYSGKRQGKILVVERTNERYHRNVVWRARCDCGNEIKIPASSIRKNMPQSCGCELPQGRPVGVNSRYRDRHEKV